MNEDASRDAPNVLPFARKPAADPFPQRALTPCEWRSAIFDQARITPEVYWSDSIDVDTDAVDEIIRRIAKYGVIGV